MAPTFYHYLPVPVADKSESMLRCRRLGWLGVLGILLVLGVFVCLIVFAVRANSKACNDGLLAEQVCRNVTCLLELQLNQTRQDLLRTMDQVATCHHTLVNVSASLEMEKAQGLEQLIQKEELQGEVEKLKQKLQEALEETREGGLEQGRGNQLWQLLASTQPLDGPCVPAPGPHCSAGLRPAGHGAPCSQKTDHHRTPGCLHWLSVCFQLRS
ncbi:bone marrow stromal antigen 2 isoform X1 [Eumetopias jubatus]|uniref:bone marrow stromal antigen 2 isoform X1 n=1 Tax=Eumetopias jubatus TaxID=34886 RepID=UPI0010163665|nr:bone marrow stromal antigen 2 isoform X1 [Eumetopias jubatus]